MDVVSDRLLKMEQRIERIEKGLDQLLYLFGIIMPAATEASDADPARSQLPKLDPGILSSHSILAEQRPFHCSLLNPNNHMVISETDEDDLQESNIRRRLAGRRGG